jgi:hypothetical protein
MDPNEFKELLDNIEEQPELLEVLREYVQDNVQKVDNSYGDYYGGHTVSISIEFKGRSIHSHYDSSASRSCYD